MSYEQFFKAVRKQKKSGAAKPTPQKPKSKPKSNLTEAELRAAFNVKPKSRKRFPPVIMTLALMAFCGLAGFGYTQPHVIEDWLSYFEVAPMSIAKAADESKADNTGANVGKTAKPSATGETSNNMVCPDVIQTSKEDLSHFSKLSERKHQLDLREQELNMLEEELHKQRAEVEARIQKLESIRAEISTVLKERVEIDQERVNTLVEFYSNMKPKQAADIFKDLNEDLAVEVLGKMKKKNAAEIMNLLPANKAKALSEKFTGYSRR